jgi:hypothetical protein
MNGAGHFYPVHPLARDDRQYHGAIVRIFIENIEEMLPKQIVD